MSQHRFLFDSDKALNIRVDQLFEKNNVSTIKQIHEDTKQDIEKKKQKLRNLVGTRYRDLIDSADSIIAMSTNSQTIFTHLSSIEEKCKKLQTTLRTPLPIYDEKDNIKQSIQLFDLANRIKELVDTPERIWVALEQHDYIVASNMYLQAYVLHDSLLSGDSSRKLLNSIPLLSRQWATINQFPTKIKNASKSRLLTNNITSVDFARALYALIQLDGISLEESLIEFMNSRRQSLQQLISSLMNSERLTESQTIEKVKNLVKVVQNTLLQVATIFVSTDFMSEKDRDAVFANQYEIDFENPSSLLIQLLRLDTPKEIPIDFIKSNCTTWLKDCKTTLENSPAIFSKFTSAKQLIHLEKLVWEQIHVFTDFSLWTNVLQSFVSDNQIDLWSSIFHKLFIQQSQQIILTKFKAFTISALLEDGLTHLSNMREVPTGNYVWDYGEAESVDEIKQKAKGIPKPMLLIVKNIDDQLQNCVNDFQYLLDDKIIKELKSTNFTTIKQKSIADLKSFIQENCFNTLNTIVDTINLKRTNLLGLEQASNLPKILFLSQLCESISQISTQIPLIFPPISNTPTSGYSTSVPFTFSRLKLQKNPLKSKLEDIFHSEYLKGFTIWAKTECLTLITLLDNIVCKEEDWSSTTLRKSSWSTIEIPLNEKDAKELIKIPSFQSPFISNFLFKICKSFHEISSYSIHPTVIKYFCEILCFNIPAIYRKLFQNNEQNKQLSKKVSREGLVQILFDVKFLFDVLSCTFDHPDNWPELLTQADGYYADMKSTLSVSIKKQNLEFLTFLKQQFEPIDLAFYEPRVNTNVQKSYLQSTVSFGYLTNLNRLYMQGQSGKITMDRPNVIPLAPTVNRFPILPISSKRR